jgi:hypothetical protein
MTIALIAFYASHRSSEGKNSSNSSPPATCTSALCNLQSQLPGRVFTPNDGTAFSLAAAMWSPEFSDRRPAVVVQCASESDVLAVIQYARIVNLPVRVRSGGHAALGWSTCADATCIVADVSRLNAISPDVSSERVTVGPGAFMIDAQKALAPLGFAINAGSGQTISFGGFVTGGGLGMFTRYYGVMCDTVLSLRVALANGSIIVASSASNSTRDLWWAFSGGSGGYGIVTEFTLKMFPLPANGKVSTARVRWTENPDQKVNLTSVSAGYMQWLKSAAPKIAQPTLNYDSTGSSLTASFFYHGAASDLAQTIAVLNGSYAPGLAYVISPSEGPLLDVYSRWADDSRYYMALFTFMSGSDGIPSSLTPRILQWTNNSHQTCGPKASCSIHALSVGGTSSELPIDQNAWPHRGALVDIIISVDATDADAYTIAKSWAKNAWTDITGAYGAWPRRVYVNSPLDESTLVDWRSAYFGTHYAALLATKAKYDPNNMFRQPGTVQPDAE